MQIDHLMWACPDLEQGCTKLAALTGVAPEAAGSHSGMGTRNALLSLGPRCYLEVIAPDPEQPLADNFGARLAALATDGLLSWAAGAQHLDELRTELHQQAIQTSRVQATSRRNPAGELLQWQLLFIAGVELAPFFIDWLACTHPAATSPSGCQLQELQITAAATEPLQRLCGQVPRLSLSQGPTASLQARLDTPHGEVWLESLEPRIALF